MSDFICINDRNQLPKYIPGYDTPEKAEAASLAMSADQVRYVEYGTNLFFGPGSYIKSVTLTPKALAFGSVDLTMEDPDYGNVSMRLHQGGTYTTIQPPVTLLLGATQTGSSNGNISTGSDITVIVTGYFTPVV